MPLSDVQGPYRTDPTMHTCACLHYKPGYIKSANLGQEHEQMRKRAGSDQYHDQMTKGADLGQ